MKFKIQVPEKLGKFLDTSLKFCKSSAGFVKDYAVAVVTVVALLFLSMKAPEIHNHWLRYKVGTRTYTIRDSAKSGGGTGSAVKAPSGQTYILTNDHVCEVSKDKVSVLVTDEEGNAMRRRIIAHDENSDLCLVEGMPGVEGLSVARSAPVRGDILNIIGHPHLMPLTLSKGEYIAPQDVSTLSGPIAMQNPDTGVWEQYDVTKGGILPEQCQMAKNKQVDIDIPVFIFTIKVKLCIVVIHDAYATNAIILPGNSGSPVVNALGQIEGVAFAGNEANWGFMISLADIQSFLKNY